MQRVKLKERVEGGGNYFSTPNTDVEFISSGCKTFDLALGGGWAEARVANIIGDTSTGKTLLCIEAAANFCAKYSVGKFKKQKVRYREAESAWNTPYARALGMPIERVDFGEPLDTVEDMFEDLRAVVRGAKGPELYICDSLDSLSDRAELERDMDKGTMGGDKAKKMSQLFRRLVRPLERKRITVIIVNQIRDKIGAMFGRKFTRTGGRALDFYASQKVILAHLGREGHTVRGQKRSTLIKVKAMVDKNKVGLPFRDATFNIKFGYGIDDAQACVDFLRQVKGLKALGISKPDLYVESLDELRPSSYRREMIDLHEAVEKHWYEIERELMPRRQKYGSV